MCARQRFAVSLALLSIILGGAATREARAGTFVVPREKMRSVGLQARTERAAIPSPAPWGLPSRDELNGVAPFITNSVSAAGNVNGAGYGETIVGMPIIPLGGSVEVFFRGPGGTTSQVLVEPNNGTGFGASVTAADVNGDGFTDVIVGDPREPGGGSERGAIYVYHGTSLGLAPAPTTFRYGQADFGFFGFSVAYAGDVNGDGFDDVVVGAPTMTDEVSVEGLAYVFHGGPSGLAANPAWFFRGNSVVAWFGYDVAGAGDVNGDGYDDIVVGAPLFTNGQANEGRVSLFLGSATGILPGSPENYESNLANTALGWSVAAAGDANGDGYADWAAGAPGYTNGEAAEGAVYLFEGSLTPFFGPPPHVAEGSVANDNLGYDLTPGGDFNGDGLGDLIAGRPGYTNPGGDLGAIDIMLGIWDLDIEWPFVGVFSGTTDGGGFGNQVAIGDIDGDGFSDPISLDTSGAVAPGGGNVTAGLPPPQMIAVLGFSLSEVNNKVTGVLSLGPLSAQGGTSVAIDGDVNGDGFDDALVGAPTHGNGAQSGLAQLFFGHADRPGTEPQPPFLASSPDWTYSTPGVATTWFGKAVAFAGDVNGDGYDDVIVGAPTYSNGQLSEGAAFVFYGSAGGPSTVPDWIVEGNLASASFGNSVASAGDVNGDGYADVLVGAPSLSNPQTAEGAAYLYYGSPLGLSHAPARVYEGNADDYNLGECVAGLGDVDGDGYDDFALGAPSYSNGQPFEGAIFVYRGAPSGPATVWDVIELDIAGGNFGLSFDGAGDVNGDGKADLIAGAPLVTDAFNAEGRADVFHGSVGGFPSVPSWTVFGQETNAGLGLDVSTAGDINADGFSDVVVGIPGRNVLDGQVLVFVGSATGVSSFYSQIQNGSEGGLLGASVAGGGDLNGDGFGDYVAGEPQRPLPKSLNDGATHYALSGVIFPNTVADRPIDAYRPFAATSIGTGLRSDSQASYRLNGRIRSAAGRTRVRAEVESKPSGAAFTGLGLVTSPWTKLPNPSLGHPNTLAASLNVTGLAAGTKHQFRARYATRSIYFNPSPWFSPQANGARQGDVRTAGGPGPVDAPIVASTSLAFAGARPNPASAARLTTFAYALPHAGHVRLTIHDATGRLVRRLVDRDAPAGEGTAPWNLRDESEARVAAGVYFARLALGAETRESKVVVLP